MKELCYMALYHVKPGDFLIKRGSLEKCELKEVMIYTIEKKPKKMFSFFGFLVPPSLMREKFLTTEDGLYAVIQKARREEVRKEQRETAEEIKRRKVFV